VHTEGTEVGHSPCTLRVLVAFRSLHHDRARCLHDDLGLAGLTTGSDRHDDLDAFRRPQPKRLTMLACDDEGHALFVVGDRCSHLSMATDKASKRAAMAEPSDREADTVDRRDDQACSEFRKALWSIPR
jgi:hypothetical protein